MRLARKTALRAGLCNEVMWRAGEPVERHFFPGCYVHPSQNNASVTSGRGRSFTITMSW